MKLKPRDRTVDLLNYRPTTIWQRNGQSFKGWRESVYHAFLVCPLWRNSFALRRGLSSINDPTYCASETVDFRHNAFVHYAYRTCFLTCHNCLAEIKTNNEF